MINICKKFKLIAFEKKIYIVLVCLRCVLCICPQWGYIHPDEFFQGLEPLTDVLLDLKVKLPWEFETRYPIRSITFPFLIIGIPIFIFKYLNDLFMYYFNYTLISPYVILILPRVVMLLASFVCDFYLHKVSILIHKNSFIFLNILSSSFIHLTFTTRALSNSLEFIIFSIFFKIIIYSIYKLKNKKIETNKFCFEESKQIGIVLACGFFNRPSFLFLALVPLLLFFFEIRNLYCTNILLLTNIFIYMILYFLLTSLFFIIIDTVYYKNSLLLDGIGSFTITPWNFYTYNSNLKNLKIHGIHPYWLHIFVNVPLLFGILSFIYLLNIKNMILHVYHYDSIIYNFVNFTSSITFLIAVLLFSTIPHQEPRFIIPLLLPLVICTSVYIDTGNKLYILFWIAHNIMGLIFFGFLHQGAIIKSLFYLHDLGKNVKLSNIIFANTYMVPQSLMLIEKRSPIEFYDYQGIQTFQLYNNLLEILLKDCNEIGESYLVLPATKALPLLSLIAETKKIDIIFKKKFFPQFSTENFNIISNFSLPGLIHDLFLNLQLSLYHVMLNSEFVKFISSHKDVLNLISLHQNLSHYCDGSKSQFLKLFNMSNPPYLCL